MFKLTDGQPTVYVCFGSIIITSTDVFKAALLCDYQARLQKYKKEEIVIRQELYSVAMMYNKMVPKEETRKYVRQCEQCTFLSFPLLSNQ